MPSCRELIQQPEQLAKGVEERRNLGDLRADVAVDAGDLDAR